jgi:hypothetical protein
MMSGDIANPRIWEGADAYVAPLGTTPPDDVATAWAAPWEALGLLSEDGATETRAQDTADHFAWGGLLVRTTKSKFKRTMKITCLEDNLVVFGLANPGSTTDTATGLTTRTVMTPTRDPRAFGLETRDGDITRRRLIPNGEVTEVGEVKFADSDMTAFELTITIYPDSDGVLYTDLTDDEQADENWS